MADDVTVRLTGVTQLVAGLEALQGKELAKALGTALSRSLRAEVVREMKAEARAAMKRPGSHRGHPGRPGATGPLEDRITVRKKRIRGSEVVAYSVASRAWYDHLFTRPTRRHVIEARAGGTKATGRRRRAINRLARDEYVSTRGRTQALFFDGVFRERVVHPGTGGSDWVRKAALRSAPRVRQRAIDTLTKHVAEASRRATRSR